MTRLPRFSVLFALMAPLACAQFSVVQVSGALEKPVASPLQLGSFRQGDKAVATLRVKNTAGAPATLNPFHVDGIGFVLSGAPDAPVALEPAEFVEFTVEYRATSVGLFSALLYNDRISFLLTVNVLPPLVCQVDAGSGLRDAAVSPVSFGTVDRGARRTLLFLLENRAAVSAVVPDISVSPGPFSLDSPSPAGATLQPGDSAAFEIGFVPSNTNLFTATLTIGGTAYSLQGSGRDPALPKPALEIDLPLSRSGQQGSAKVRFDAPARTSGTGTLSIGFVSHNGSSDPAIQFASGGRTVQFAVASGDSETPEIAFQTGTTAGTLTFSVELGGATASEMVLIDPAPVTIASTDTLRSPTGIELRLTGFDNTRTAAALAFTFYDSAGVAVGTVRVDAASQFASYFASSPLGGVFQLRSVFPITGDASQIAAFEAEISNSAGTLKTPRTKIP